MVKYFFSNINHDKDDESNEDVKTPNKVERIRKRQEKFNNLFANAV